MKILFLTPTFPYPPDSGGKIVVYNTIKYLSKKHQIALLSLTQRGQEKYIPGLKEYCSNIETVPIDSRFTIRGLLKNLFSSLPYNMKRYSSTSMKLKINQIIEQNSFDLVLIEHLHMGQYGELIQEFPIFLREHNIESTMMERFYRNVSNPFKKIYAYMQWLKLIRYEPRVLSNFDCCIVLSSVDQKFLMKLSAGIKSAIIPCGVDLEYFKPWSCQREKHQIVYIGSLLFRPALEGLSSFLNNIWPLVKKIRPELRFCIVGKYPVKKEAELARHPDVTLVGHVEDIRPYMVNSGLMVVPLWIGSGVRLKILEAMAMHLPVVSTSIGCEGLEVSAGEHLLVADSPEEFAEKILTLLEDQKLQDNLAQNSSKLIREKYSWDKIVDQLNRLYFDIIKN